MSRPRDVGVSHSLPELPVTYMTGSYQTATASNYQYDPERFREEVEHIKHLKEKRGSKYRQVRHPMHRPLKGLGR